ncbi:unnamed protein product [Caenorhabditis bovis]|uniref:Uncharacterized protein n=1 Tax=Caenorhabditis bovis TaxID=2654633 RepID=A0A8S1E9Q9_9PELO|nr:unnamed protein product [Caenorhabditis bovis]
MMSRQRVCQMSHLAARFVGGADVHVVDPVVDLRKVFEQEERLKYSIDSRNLKIDLEKVKMDYNEWFSIYKQWKDITDKEASNILKRNMREKKDGLLNALALPNFINHIGTKPTTILKSSKHAQYLAQQGLMRIDKINHVVHLVGFPATVQKMIKQQLIELFSFCHQMSPSYFARSAILEALNVDKKKYLSFSDGSTHFPLTYLVGNSLASMVTPFIKIQFTENNQWPISMQCAGAGYTQKKNEIDLIHSRQRMKHCILNMTQTSEEIEMLVNEANVRIGAYLDEALGLEVEVRELRGSELENYESQAYVIENRGLALSRIARIDDYVAQRLNICHAGVEKTDTTAAIDSGFVQMAYIQTDIDRIIARLIDDLIEGKEPPKLLRDAIKRTA